MATTPPPYDPHQPEFLPPHVEPPRQRRSWAAAPATYALVGINCVVFLMMLLNGVSVTSPTTDQLVHWGANHAAGVLIDGQWWRIVTATFVHVGIIHLATNMWCLWNLGLLGEPLLGSAGILIAYVLTGAAGNLLSIAINSALGVDAVGAGASGAVFGIAGALIILLKSPRLPVPPQELRSLRRSVIYFAGLNFAIGFGSFLFGSSIQIDNWAHLGGFLSGLLYALPLVPRIGSPRSLFIARRRVATGLLAGVLVLFAFYVSTAFTAR